jgi:hypothetical protein
LSRYEGAGAAKIGERGEKLSKGTHLLELQRITTSEDGANGAYYVAEYIVVESDSPIDPVTGRQIDPPGARRSWTQSLKSKNLYLAPLKAHLQAVYGIDRRNPADAADIKAFDKNVDMLLQKSEDPTDPLGLKGRRVRVVVTSTLTKSARQRGETVDNFFPHDFSPGQKDKL